MLHKYTVKMVVVCMVMLALLLSSQVKAAWKLDNAASTLNFLTTKNMLITETHHFDNLSGSVSDVGTAVIVIDTSSVNTNIGIRDDRLRKHFFEIDKTPFATFAANVNPSFLSSMEPGNGTIMNLLGTLELHGVKKELEIEVNITKLQGGYVSVATRKPLVLNIMDYGLEPGLYKLAELAGLSSILGNIPVTFNAVFREE